MQTFLPYADFSQSAKCLDYRRLGKQRIEAYQILNSLLTGSGWKHHPAVKMWESYEAALSLYMDVMIREWIARGYNNTMRITETPENVTLPSWIGGEIHASHRSNLLRKDPTYYGKFGWTEPSDLPYHWPTSDTPHRVLT